MGWQTIPNVNITTDKRVQATIYIGMLFEYFKIMASSPVWLTINNTETSVTVNIDKTTCPSPPRDNIRVMVIVWR